MSYYTGGNLFSLLAFFIWIPIAIWGMRRWPPARATATLYFGGLLLLPEVVFFKPAGLPEFAKLEVIFVWILVGALLFHRQRLRSGPKSKGVRLLVGLFLVGSVLTIFLNFDAFRVGSRFVSGQAPYDAVHAILIALLSTILPFYLGSVMFRTSKDLRTLLRIMAVSAMLYSLPMFVELIVSPQLHRWVYGFHQHSFNQTIRAGGYRPMVFMNHGLAVAFFTSLSVLAAASLHKGRVRILRFPAAGVTAYLWVVLASTKSVASLLYTTVAVPIILFTRPKVQVLVGTVLVCLLLAYPIARANEWIPVDELKAWAQEEYGPARAHSMMFRLENEELLLERAMERPWFGWGTYCRACLFEPWSGDLSSTRDGEWIIQLGDSGIVGFASRFGLMLFPLLLLLRRLRFVPRDSDRRLLGGLGLMIGFAAFDMVPNADFSRLAFILSGALFGCLTGILQEASLMRLKKRQARIAAARQAPNARAAGLAGAATLFALLLAAPVAAAAPDAVGGGFADSGLDASYYANPDLEGAPSFIRRDLRIDFDWDELRPVGGSTAEPYRSFPRDGFSIRWSGRIIPRFSEAYTFHGEADDGIRIKIRAPGESTWTSLVDRWSEAGAFESKPFQMRAGELYELQVEYRELEGRAACRLLWKSESAAAEVIDPVRQQGINISQHIWAGYVWADLMKSARYDGGVDKIDAEGWPSTSGVQLIASEMFYPSSPEMSGTYLLRFEGKAEVHQECCTNPIFKAGDRTFQTTLPKGAGYDSANNTTTSTMALDGSRTMLFFNDTQRGPASRDDGVTRLQLMRPIAQGSAEHHRADEIVYRPFKLVVEDHYTVIRYVMSDKEVGGEWSERTLPDYAFFVGSSGQPNWEYLVMLANETGRDLYVTTPIGATDEYLEKLALLTRYGSDGREPYRKPTANPLYPPLNPNLRIYVEIDNEIWNWAFESTSVAQRLTVAEHGKGSETWKAIDFDHRAGQPDEAPAMRRWHATRTVLASNTFRRVWGDAAMGSRVRILIEYQYDNYQDTALASLDFIDAYYSNRSSQNVSDPHPVSYYVWGGGGAAYYGLKDRTGQQSGPVLKDHSFEAVSIGAGTRKARPPGSAWTFKGEAGLLHPQEDKALDGFTNLPKPVDGKQAAFLIGKGSISQKVRFTKAGAYAIAFSAAGAAEGWPEYAPFDILLDGQKISPRDQSDPRVSPDTAVIGGWYRNINELEGQWGSAVFQIDKPGIRTITFVGRDEAPNYLVIDTVSVASADAILNSGFAKGEAQGQEGVPDLAYQLNSQARYARSFGLQVVAYEAGWSLGGDFWQVPIQNWCKLRDPRAASLNDQAMKLWDQSGSFMTVWGVYTYWPSYDFAGAANYPIMRSYRGASQRLRDEASFGRALPATLRIDDTDWSHRAEASGWRRYVPCLNELGEEWHSWMLTAPKTGTYSIRVKGSGTGRLLVEVDGEPVIELGSLEEGTAPPASVKLSKGAHALRVILVGDELGLDEIQVSAE